MKIQLKDASCLQSIQEKGYHVVDRPPIPYVSHPTKVYRFARIH